MATFHINRKALAGTLAPIAVAGAILAPVAGAQTPNPSAAPSAAQQVQAAQYSQGFDVYNNTGHTLVLMAFRGASGIAYPALGSHLKPGESQHFEVPFNFFHATTGEAWYRTADGSSKDKLGARFEVSNFIPVTSVGIDINDNTPAPAKAWTYGNKVTFTNL